MLIVPAKDLEIVAAAGTESVVLTDPFPVGDNDRATVEFHVQVLGTTGPAVAAKYAAEVSLDAVNFTSVPGLAVGLTVPGIAQQTASANGAFIRFLLKLVVDPGVPGDIGWTTVDLHVLLDHA
jgi:hypothetical protein